jgi:dolichol-phosphate mannosyltransferase
MSTPVESSITVIVAALNEQERLARAVSIVGEVLPRWFEDYEILIVNDGSVDRTGEIAEEIAACDPHVAVIHHQRPHGLGGVVREGIARARMCFVMYVDGKGATTAEALDRIFARRCDADLVIPFPENLHERPRSRQAISWLFRKLVGFLFRLDLRYYNHLLLCRTELARAVNIRTNSFAFQAERVVKMIKSGCTYVEVGVRDDFQAEWKRTRAFKLKNVLGVGLFFIMTFWDVYLGRSLRACRK